MSERRVPIGRYGIQDVVAQNRHDIARIDRTRAAGTVSETGGDYRIGGTDYSWTNAAEVALADLAVNFYVGGDAIPIRLEWRFRVHCSLDSSIFQVKLYLDGAFRERFDYNAGAGVNQNTDISDFVLIDFLPEGDHSASLTAQGVSSATFQLQATTGQALLKAAPERL